MRTVDSEAVCTSSRLSSSTKENHSQPCVDLPWLILTITSSDGVSLNWPMLRPFFSDSGCTIPSIVNIGVLEQENHSAVQAGCASDVICSCCFSMSLIVHI